MRIKWSMITFLSAISVNVMASPVISNDKPRSPFSIDRQSESNTVKNRANINNSIGSYSIT
ncbi:pilus assembly protein, partial [Escherichia coli]|nr:pilus assembly protein [Escherichia coli]